MPEHKIAYFSMEIGLSADMATYSGGLGVLAGDTLRAAADWGLPLVAVTLVHRNGYFRQHLDEGGAQTESPDSWNVADRLREMDPRVDVEIGGKTVRLRAWLEEVVGILGQKVTVYFLDSDLEENDPASRVRIPDEQPRVAFFSIFEWRTKKYSGYWNVPREVRKARRRRRPLPLFHPVPQSLIDIQANFATIPKRESAGLCLVR